MSLDVTSAETWLLRQGPRSIDLLFGSPPYAEKHERYPDLTEPQRPPRDWTAWAHWMESLTHVACRVAKIVFWVCDSPRVDGEYRPAVEQLKVSLAGNPDLVLLTSHIWHKNGPPGGPNWPGHDWEFVVGVAARGSEFHYDPSAIGHPAKFSSGPGRQRGPKGVRVQGKKGAKKGVLARPRDVLSDFFRVTVGGLHMGRSVGEGDACTIDVEDDKLSCTGQAPFPWWLATRFVVGFSPPGGVVGDVFAGTGTTMIAARDAGRTFRGCDLSPSQAAIARARAARLGYTDSAGPST